MNVSNVKKVYKIVSQIPKGKVLTYGRVAELAGINNPRLVGSILHKNTDPDHVPCHRVVSAQGKVAKSYAFGGGNAHAVRLKEEGVKVVAGNIDLHTFLWRQNYAMA